MLTLRGPYCVVTEGSVTTRHDMTARHRHDVAIDNPVSYIIGIKRSLFEGTHPAIFVGWYFAWSNNSVATLASPP